MTIKRSALWDKRANNDGLRCSSVGDDANKYHDPSTVSVEASGRSLASLAPARGRLRGVIVPRASIEGGSRGVNPHKPSILNIIDIDDNRRSFSVDLSQIPKDALKETYEKIQENELLSGDLAAIAEETFNQFAISDVPLPSDIVVSGVDNTPERESPIGGRGYVVPRADVLAKQANVQKKANAPKQSAAKQVAVKQTAPAKQITEDAPVEQQPESIPAPTVVVKFEMDGWGTFEAAYHDVIQSDCLLVLVYDDRFTSGMRFKPPASGNTITVTPDNLNVTYTVSSTGTFFTYNEITFYILVIEGQETNKK